MSQYICCVETKCLWYELGLHGLVVTPRLMVLTVLAHHETLVVVALCCVVDAVVQILQQWPLVRQRRPGKVFCSQQPLKCTSRAPRASLILPSAEHGNSYKTAE